MLLIFLLALIFRWYFGVSLSLFFFKICLVSVFRVGMGYGVGLFFLVIMELLVLIIEYWRDWERRLSVRIYWLFLEKLKGEL